jgi:flagellar hook protein FlgE
MIGSLYTGISGLNANARSMAIIGDNIANANTTAYKSNKAVFTNILNQSLPGLSGSDVGRGVILSGQTPTWSQGSLQNTEKSTDLAINGRGFFILSDGGQEFYTRAGNFNFDENGKFVNLDGFSVQGWDLRSGGMIGGPTENIVIPQSGTIGAQATTQFVMDISLNSNPDADSLYSTAVTVYDSLGNEVPVTITFTRTGNPNEWDWSSDVPATLGAVSSGGSGTFTFNTDGSLQNGTDPLIGITLVTGAAPLSLTWDLYDAVNATNGNLTQYSTESKTGTTATIQQDGFGAGALRAISINEEGVISGTYSNGRTQSLYQIALADFSNYAGLKKMGGNLYGASINSGQVIRGISQQGSFGSISPESLELSNVDLASEFVRLITTQRAFQANSRVITASDEILTELINIKR